MPSAQPAPPPSPSSRLLLVALVLGGLAMLLWLVASLSVAAFG